MWTSWCAKSGRGGDGGAVTGHHPCCQELTTWGHFVLEQDYDHADRVIATITQRGWNDVSVDEAGEDCRRPCPDGCVREKHGARQRHVLFASTLCPSGCVPA